MIFSKPKTRFVSPRISLQPNQLYSLILLVLILNSYCLCVLHFKLRPSSSKNTYFRLSICPSVCPSITPFWQCSCHRIILKFFWVITIDRRDVLAKGQGQRSKVKVIEVMTPLSRFRTVTPVWIHIRQWNDAQSFMLLRRGALLFFKVICQISRSHD